MVDTTQIHSKNGLIQETLLLDKGVHYSYK